MVFQKKGATPLKNVQPKKGNKKQVEAEDDDSDMFNDMDDSDEFEDSEDDMPVQKTPQNKTSKGRQSMSEKKVTFDMSGKNTPGKKTPNKNNSLVMKKTPTPAKGGKPQLKKGPAEDSDDDDDEDDDDEDIDDEEDLDLDMDDDDEDDDDDDDEDEDEDDDDDDEEDEEQKPNHANKQKNNVEKNKQKTPIKNENAKGQSPKLKTPKGEAVSPKKEQASPQKNAATQSADVQRRKERDAKTLFVGGLPLDATTEELKSLSPDITNVVLPQANPNRKNQKSLFAFLWFNSEAKAEANYKALQNKKLRGQTLNIDFAGEKSSKKKAPTSEKLDSKSINERKLFVTGIPVNATLKDVAAHFPKAYQISFNKSPTFRTASINFDRIEDATEAFNTKKEVEVLGAKLTVVHSTKSQFNTKNKRKRTENKKNNNAKQGGNPSKKMKFMKKEESSDEE